ncbi:probable LRR receptor-like serine/threonine-protein kinase At4g29180 [Humulus lupulus]|uniref:probable LRR receptor-like serine/threonine-protein kinase At4g29180 n=1 Tax=Humulus lupulus TaxID=3486 RepID=UPI002B40C13A|nr:probable LRR receptor-like serine/threonine-protein kinase At4g29180 [Humulus lupulus]
MIVLIGYFLLLSATLAQAQRQIGYISIDCGSLENFYEDPDTGINYVSDGTFIMTGVNKNISSEYQYPNNPNLPLPVSDLRSFPQGNKNCYSLKPTVGIGGLNLIRATFLYGNYDGKNKPPEFDLYVDVNLWFTVKFRNASEVVTTEIITRGTSDTVHICLVNKGSGTPFISALELRPLNSSVYGTEFGTNASLVLFQRLDIGKTNGTGRYQDDMYDRIWSSYMSTSWDSITTSEEVNNYENGYRVPLEVIMTAARPRNDSETLELKWSATDFSSEFYVFMCFAELEKLGRNQSRKFDVTWNGSPLFGPLVPRYLYATVVSNSKALVGKEHQISIRKTKDSTRPPILNAFEIYMVKQKDELPTFSGDVDAIEDVKSAYQITKNWVGDPCGPRNFSWEGLKCSNNASSPRIISLNLTSSRLRGNIASSISKLSLLEFLDLSNNNLTGPMPEFLENLKSLKLLNLKGNQFSGVVPKDLVERSKNGLLTLSVDNRNLCSSGSCKKKKNIAVPIAASLASVAFILIVLIIILKKKRKKKSDAENTKKTGRTLALKKSQYNYDEVVEITNNFEKEIGKGGFGVVYHGYMKDGTQVAVKILSPLSSQGPREFQTEAELLMRIHHRNLASFIGYCDEDENLALIYEYMPNGNLKECLSDKSLHLSWETRLRIAVDSAQGLEYLHHGCKPAIVHRDVKTANILLGENLDAKIADFGLSKVFTSDNNETQADTTVMGTAGYLDPEYYRSQKLTEKSDVYSFGVVLLELITGQPAIIRSEERIHIIHWVNSLLEEGDVTSVIDPRLQDNFDVNSLRKALEVAMACTECHSEDRATMSYVLAELKQCLGVDVSREQERTPAAQGQRLVFHSYASTPEMSSVYTDSMNMDSMTAPLAR